VSRIDKSLSTFSSSVPILSVEAAVVPVVFLLDFFVAVVGVVFLVVVLVDVLRLGVVAVVFVDVVVLIPVFLPDVLGM